MKLMTEILTLGISPAALFAAQAQTPLPDDILIIPPSPAVATNAVAFSGAWMGAWGDSLPSALVVEQIGSDGKVLVIYSWGDSPMFNIRHGWRRESGQITNGNLHLTSTSGVNRDFWFAKNGNLLGRYEMTNSPPSFIEMVHIASTNAPVIKEAARKVPVIWEEKRFQCIRRSGRRRENPFNFKRQSITSRHRGGTQW